MARIVAPVAITGVGVGGVEFEDGVAVTDNHAVIAYCRDLGYKVTDDAADEGAPKRPRKAKK